MTSTERYDIAQQIINSHGADKLRAMDDYTMIMIAWGFPTMWINVHGDSLSQAIRELI